MTTNYPNYLAATVVIILHPFNVLVCDISHLFVRQYSKKVTFIISFSWKKNPNQSSLKYSVCVFITFTNQNMFITFTLTMRFVYLQSSLNVPKYFINHTLAFTYKNSSCKWKIVLPLFWRTKIIDTKTWHLQNIFG